MEGDDKLILEKCNIHNFRMKVKAVVCSGVYFLIQVLAKFLKNNLDSICKQKQVPW